MEVNGKKIPLLTEKDVECRVQSVSDKGYATLLLYKDARVDMKILDLVFGRENWQREHTLINGELFCTVSIWDDKKGQWVGKQDVGTESNTEAKKGQASDSFKRACVNWGIGRELYNAPFVCVKLDPQEIYKNKAGKNSTNTKFVVKSMKYDEEQEEFVNLVITDSNGRERYKLGGKIAQAPAPVAEQWVSKKDGKTIVKAKDGKWHELQTLPPAALENIANDGKYKACHLEAYELIAKKGI